MKLHSFFVIIAALLLTACGHPPRRDHTGPRGHRPQRGLLAASGHRVLRTNGSNTTSSMQQTGESVIVNGHSCPVVIYRGHKCVIVNGARVAFEQLRVNQPQGMVGNQMQIMSQPNVSGGMPSTSYGTTPYGQTGYSQQQQYGPDPRFPGVDSGGVYHAY